MAKLRQEFLLRELRVGDEVDIPLLKLANTGTLSTIEKGDRSAKIIKAMSIREHWLMQEYEQKRILLDYVKSKLNFADMHTKVLGRVDLYFQMHGVGMRRIVRSTPGVLEGNEDLKIKVFIVGTNVAVTP